MSHNGFSTNQREQFRYINKQAAEFIDAGGPAISEDAKKRKLGSC
jgi:hypothetical protein